MNEFKTGQKVICISNIYYETSLTVGKEYEVFSKQDDVIFIVEDDWIQPKNLKEPLAYPHSYLRFVSIAKYRKEKIKSLYD